MSEKTPILLLGATGLLGHNVLKILTERGIPVKAAVRRRAALREDVTGGREGRGIEILEGDILDETFLESCSRGCRAVINCAGTTDMSLARPEDYLPVNLRLPESVLRVMDRTGVDTFIDTSSANTIGSGTEDSPADETFPFSAPFTESYYAQSKKQSEESLIGYARTHPSRKIVIVNPGFMVGPYDTGPSSGKLLIAGYRRPLMAAPGGGKSFIHVRDAATAIVNAIVKGRSGERYLLTGESISLPDFYRMQAEVCGYRQKVAVLPDFLCRTAGRAGDLARAAGLRCSACTINVRQLLCREYYDNSKAVRELDMPVTPIAEAIRDFWEDRRRVRPI